MATDTAPALPFEVASKYSSRQSFQVPTQSLGAAAPTQVTPIQVPAVGFLFGILLEITLVGTGGTTPANVADGPFSAIQSINFRNAAGVNLIPPVTGYQLFLMNKYGGQTLGFGASSDPRAGIQFANTAPSAHFYLWLPLGIDASEAYGALPALASNANYQVELTFAAITSIYTGAPAVTAQVNATAHYFDFPVEMTADGIRQATTPPGSPATSLWFVESPTVSPGTQLVQSNNVGNIIRNHILVLRNSAGARIDVNGWPALLEQYLDNNPRFSLRKNEHEFLMSRWYGLLSATKDVVNGLDTGVYVIPYHALNGSQSGDPSNTRAQLLPTLTATLLQFRAQDFGSAASRLEIITEAISTTNSAYLFSK